MVFQGAKINPNLNLRGKNMLPNCINYYDNAIGIQINLPITGCNSNMRSKSEHNCNTKCKCWNKKVELPKREKYKERIEMCK